MLACLVVTSSSRTYKRVIHSAVASIRDLFYMVDWGFQGQKGKEHPQSKDPEWKIYKLFDQIASKSPLEALTESQSATYRPMSSQDTQRSRVGSRVDASLAPSRNTAERTALAECVEGKVAAMGKPMQSEKGTKAKAKKDEFT